MENDFLTRKAKGGKIFFSELLADPPSDEILAELFPYGRKNAFFITQTALKVLILKLNGLNVEEIGAKLNLTRYQVYGRLKNVGLKLVRGPIPDYIELDIPALRKNVAWMCPLLAATQRFLSCYGICHQSRNCWNLPRRVGMFQALGTPGRSTEVICYCSRKKWPGGGMPTLPENLESAGELYISA